MSRKIAENEELEKKCADRDRDLESMEIKKTGLEKQYEIQKKQNSEKIVNMQDLIASEKETRDTWIKRYESEQQAHTATQGELVDSKSQLKDQVLQVRNEEIKLSTANRQI